MLEGLVVALVGLIGPGIAAGGSGGGGGDGEDRGVRLWFLGLIGLEDTLEKRRRVDEGVFGGVAFSCVDEFKHGKINYEGGRVVNI